MTELIILSFRDGGKIDFKFERGFPALSEENIDLMPDGIFVPSVLYGGFGHAR
jgi:hypothetical protein